MRPDDSVSAHAVAECVELARAIDALGGRATAAQLADRLGLDRRAVNRRLCSAGSMAPCFVHRYFRVVVRRCPALGTAAAWELTDGGRRLLAAAKEAA